MGGEKGGPPPVVRRVTSEEKEGKGEGVGRRRRRRCSCSGAVAALLMISIYCYILLFISLVASTLSRVRSGDAARMLRGYLPSKRPVIGRATIK